MSEGERPPVLVTTEPRLEDVIRQVATREDGAICTFLGTARRHSDGKEVVELRYESYPEMAERVLLDVLRRAELEHPGTKVAAQHRIGRCPLGEAAVAVAAASAHRDGAFTACRWMIDTLKAEVPIWKQEVYADGSAWIGEPGSSPDGGPTGHPATERGLDRGRGARDEEDTT